MLLIYTEYGANIRDHFRYKILYRSLLIFFPRNSSRNWVRRVHQRMTINPRLENFITDRLIILRQRRRAMRLEIIGQMQTQVNTRRSTRNVPVSDILSGQVEVRLMLKKKSHNLKELDSTTDDPLICSICLNDVEDGNLIGDIPCNHRFHLDCLKDWLSRKNCCPLCLDDNIGHHRVKRKSNNAIDV